ncbi:uncharacterized protein LOC133173216 [Saccostrea echinata]|uniref:uncharacterized protein LOC133173216 n=1 Tax=Saccostrea echinata TaxID=191078 RepID=UPI002A811D1D|nr:uncharacterized protein LOC133173216 [Saccostrea echinata]
MAPILILLTLSMVTVTTGGADVYCDMENNQFYVEQWGQCKDCDRCPKGYGLDIKRNINIDPVHGALSCRGCVKCIDGETFESVIGYGECKSCTNCKVQEKSIATPCTKERDTVCTRKFVMKESQTPVEDNNGVQNKGYHTDLDPLSTTVGAVVVFIFVVPSAVILVIMRKRLNCRKQDSSMSDDVEENDRLGKKDVECDPPTCKTEMETINSSELECEARPLTESERNKTNKERRRPSDVSIDFPSNFYYDLKHLDDNDLETDTEEQKSDPRLNEIPSDKELQYLCPHIAHCNNYARLGRELGVEDSEIKRIKEEQHGDLRETAFQTLKKWRELNGQLATKFKLQCALARIGINGISLVDDP